MVTPYGIRVQASSQHLLPRTPKKQALEAATENNKAHGQASIRAPTGHHFLACNRNAGKAALAYLVNPGTGSNFSLRIA